MHDFNPRARVGRDVDFNRMNDEAQDFNPRARVGRDLVASRRAWRRSMISIHAPAWGATPRWIHTNHHRRISIHAPAWGATIERIDAVFLSLISIHAPAWGATDSNLFYDKDKKISIHAPAWGATRRDRLPRHPRPYFNPRARVGRDIYSIGRNMGRC